MHADWQNYELILFNIIQNAVKYIKMSDDNIIIIVSCKPRQNKNNPSNLYDDDFKS